MARQQSDFPSNGRQGELQVQRGADMPPRDTELRDLPTRDTTVRDTVRERSLGELFRDLTTETSELVTKEIALVKAPFTCPNNSLSNTPSAKPPVFTVIKGRPLRSDNE